MSDMPARMKVCDHCPFRSDIPGYLMPSRAEDIVLTVFLGFSFACHETIETREDPNGGGWEENVATGKSLQCAGALRLLEHEGRIIPEQHPHLDRETPVHATVASFLDHHSESRDRRAEHEHA